MSAEQTPPAAPPFRFRPEVRALAYRIIDAVKSDFDEEPGPLFAEASVCAVSLLLLMVAKPGCGSNILRGASVILHDMSLDAATVEAFRDFITRGRAVN